MMENSRVWIYCRVAHEDKMALEWQKNQLERYAYAHGMEIAGITAKHECGHILSRPGIEELNLAIEKGLADILLVKETGRLVRGFTQAAEYLEWLEQKGVCVVCMDEPASVRYNLVNMVTDVSSL